MKTPLFVQGLEKLKYLSDEIPEYKISTLRGEISFLMFGSTSEFRVRTFFTKEPETLSWIDSFNAEAIFWDIGANIGCYSLYAASRNDITVCAFEPSAVNFWLLSANVGINKFSKRLKVYPFALSDRTGIVEWSPDMTPGSAHNQLFKNKQDNYVGIQSYSVDDLIAIKAMPFPNHLKLDVDGIEPMILAGAEKTLSDRRLLSVMVEVDESNKSYTKNIIKLFLNHGFNKPITRHSPYFDDNYYLPVSNYLFERKH
jgi:FkbM family methyltransferase